VEPFVVTMEEESEDDSDEEDAATMAEDDDENPWAEPPLAARAPASEDSPWARLEVTDMGPGRNIDRLRTCRPHACLTRPAVTQLHAIILKHALQGLEMDSCICGRLNRIDHVYYSSSLS